MDGGREDIVRASSKYVNAGCVTNSVFRAQSRPVILWCECVMKYVYAMSQNAVYIVMVFVLGLMSIMMIPCRIVRTSCQGLIGQYSGAGAGGVRPNEGRVE
jgi:hypothetical protein